jgi:hypothetical protein
MTSRLIMLIIVAAIFYVVGAKFPMLANKIGV